MSLCNRCQRIVGTRESPGHMASVLGGGVYCYDCFKFLAQASNTQLEVHKTEVRNRRSKAKRLWWETRRSIMKPVIVTVQYTIDNEEDLAKLVASLGATPATPATKDKPGKLKAVEEEPEEEEETEEEEDEEEDEEPEEEEEDSKPSKVKITPELRDATKLREVLDVLVNKYNIRSKKALLKECLALKSKIDVLKRIQDLEQRVPRAAELVDPSIKD